MLSAKQGNYCYHLYNVFGMTRSLTGDWTRVLCNNATVAMFTWLTTADYIYTKLQKEQVKMGK